eukprot:753200-Hanusia_phi.AAC.3
MLASWEGRDEEKEHPECSRGTSSPLLLALRKEVCGPGSFTGGGGQERIRARRGNERVDAEDVRV